MKTKIYTGTLLAILILFVVGCQKNFLDMTPQGTTPMNNFYKTDAQAEGAVMAGYDIFQSLNARPWSSMWMLKTLLSDEVYTGGGGRGDQPPYEEINEFRFNASNPVISWLFQFSYQGIYRVNLVIQNVKPDDPAKKRIIAEAKTLRALFYFDLVTLWGKVPLVIKPAASSANYAQPRAAVSAVWAQIDKDLAEAAPDLPLKSQETYPARVSKGFAQALLGKSLLYQKKYSEAAVQFQKVIDSHEYSLIPDFSRRLRIEQEFGSESLFEISYSNAKHYTWDSYLFGTNGRVGEESNIHWQLGGPNGEGGFFEGGSTGILGGWGFAYPDSSIYNAFIRAGDTIRRKASIMTEAELIAQGGKLRNSGTSALSYGCVGLIRLKYASYAGETDTTAIPDVNYGTNLRVMEYDDVLLMASEAYNKTGDAKALPLINQVRKRAHLPALTVTGQALFNAIKNERRLELAFEGVRFQDLIRWGDASKVLANQGKEIPLGDGTYLSLPDAGFKSYNVLLPIPEQEMSVNLLITQNPGY